MRNVLAIAAVLGWALVARGQWALQDSGTAASFRGVHYVGGGVAWVSGTGGTVLRTVDMGKTWVKCAVPKGAEKLDFRGVQAFDAKTAVVMSSGPGEASRLYRTTDGCSTWKKVFDDPWPNGFFDDILNPAGKQIYVLGDPVDQKFALLFSQDGGENWFVVDDKGLEAPKDAGAFAASNSAMVMAGGTVAFGTGGPLAAVYRLTSTCSDAGACESRWVAAETPLAHGGAPEGVFSLGGRLISNARGVMRVMMLAVGGDYSKPASTAGTAAWSSDGGATWQSAQTAPGGYRSAVALDREKNAWLAVGPNGTDVSVDDGRNWRALTPGVGDAPDADKQWNALSLPFVVGEKGRIGILRDGVLNSAAESAKDAKGSPR